MTDDLIGRVFDGRYRIVAPLATGGMATVYRARQLNVDREVAVKIMHPEDRSERELAMRFESEAKIISDLRHPNTLKLIDYGHTEDEMLYIVTELLSGRSLESALKDEAPFTPRRTLGIMRDVCLSLAEAHARGVVHRDLKPANVFLERVGDQEVVKVLDFGIAKVTPAESIEERGGPGATPPTMAGVLLGTPSHISPEMALGRPVDGRTDLYSLGVVAYQCLCGVLPFEGAPITQIAAHGTDRPPRPSKKGSKPKLPPRVEALVMRLLEKDPAARAESAAALAEEIDELLTEAKALSRRPSLLVFVAPVVAAAAAIGAYVALEPGPEPPLVVPENKTEVDAVTAVRPRDTSTGTVSSVAIVRDAGVRTGLRILAIDEIEGFLDEAALKKALDRTETVLVDCHEATQGGDERVLTLWFRVSRTGNSIEVTPKDEPSERFRRCVALRLPTVRWPKRNGTGAFAIDVGDR